jgi:hypothetical protein
MTDEQYRDKAREQYGREGSIEIDVDAPVSRGSDPGAYVQAWVWVYDDALQVGEGSEDDPDQPEQSPDPDEVLP